MGQYRDRQKKARLSGEDGFLVEDEAFRELFPAIAEFVMGEEGESLDDGAGATMLLFVEEGLFKICLNDRTQDASLWASGASVELALQSLETTLRDGTGAWRTKQRKSRR